MTPLLVTLAAAALALPVPGAVAAQKPAPRVERAFVNGYPSRDPAVYSALLEALPHAEAPPSGTPEAEIRVETDGPARWESGRPLRYVPAANAVNRDGAWFRVPDPIAARIEDDLRTARREASGRSWPGYATLVALAVLGAAVAWAALHRRRGPRPARG